MNFNFAELEAFLAIVETGSFHAAAERLAVSQSAITRRLQKLEAALETPLFERSTRKLKPTLAARGLRPRAEAILNEAREVAHEFGDSTLRYAAQRVGLVTIATLPTLTVSILPRAILAFEASGLTARFDILDSFAGEAIDAVASGIADLGLGFVGIREPGLEVDILGEDEFVLVVARANPLARRRRLRWVEIADAPLIVPGKGGGNRMLIDHAMAAERLQLNWNYQVRRSSSVLDLVAAGIGVGILPASAMSSYADAAVVAIRLDHPRVSRTLGIFRQRDKPLGSAAQAFYQVLLATTASSKGWPAH